MHKRSRWLELSFLVAAGALLVVRMLPETSPGIALKLLIVVPAVSLLPGLTVIRLIGSPQRFTDLIGPAFAWSCMIVGLGLAVTVTFDANLSLGIGTAIAVSLITLAAGRNRPLPRPSGGELVPVLLVLAAGCLFAFVAWLNAFPLNGDALEHLARTRKLTDMPRLTGLSSVNVVGPNAGLHPGYAFPLWHTFMAFFARLGRLDPAPVVQYSAVFLTPVALLISYASGVRIFRSERLGLATVAMQMAWLGLPLQGAGYYRFMAFPGFVSILIFMPAALALLFAYLDEGRTWQLVSLAATSFAVTLAHASYTPFIVLSVGCFWVLRSFNMRDKQEILRTGACVAALTLPFLAYMVWALPLVKDSGSSSLSPDQQRVSTISHYETLVDTEGQGADMSVRIKPGFVSRGGAAEILAFLLAPLALLRRRERWASYVLATMSVDLALLMLFPLFSRFMDVASLSQARRLLFFLPVPFALVGGIGILARWWWTALVALAVGIFLEIHYHGDFNYVLLHPGPGWVAWVALFGCSVGAVVSIFWKREVSVMNTRWMSLALLAFIAPIAGNGIMKTHGALPDHSALPQALLQTARQLPPGSVVFAPEGMAFRLAGYAPVFAVAVTESHGGNTRTAKLDVRLADVARFFRSETTLTQARDLLVKYESDFLGLSPELPYPKDFISKLGTPLYDDGDWKLYKLGDTATAL